MICWGEDVSIFLYLKKKCFFLVDFLGIKIYIIVGVVVRIDW